MERSTVQSCLAAPSISRNEHESAFSRHPKPEFCSPVSPSSVERAQGRPGADGHPRSAARKCSARKPHSSIQVTPNTRPSLRNGLTAYAALSPATNSCCHRHFAKVDAPRPVGAMHRRKKLGCSDDSRDHTVLPYAAISGFAKGLRRTQPASTQGFAGDTGAVRSTRLAASSRGSAQSSARPAPTSAPALPRPPHPQPTFVTTYDRPSPRVGMEHGYRNSEFR